MLLKKKQLLKILPYTGGFIIFCGIIKGILYYNQFHVSIVSFIEFSEFVTLFLNDIMYYGLYFIVLQLFLFISDNRQAALKRDETRFDIMANPKLLKRLWGYVKYMWPLCVVIIVMAIALTLPLFFPTANDVSLLRIHFFSFLSIFLYLIGSFEFNRQFVIHFKDLPDMTYSNLFGIAFVFLSIVVSSAYTDAYLVKNSYKNIGVRVILEKDTIVSDSTRYYIGKTNNYIFFYNEKNNNSTAIPMNRVKEISFPK